MKKPTSPTTRGKGKPFAGLTYRFNMMLTAEQMQLVQTSGGSAWVRSLIEEARKQRAEESRP